MKNMLVLNIFVVSVSREGAFFMVKTKLDTTKMLNGIGIKLVVDGLVC